MCGLMQLFTTQELHGMELNEETFAMVLPKSMQNKVDSAVIGKITALCDDADLADTIKENIISYTSVLKDGKFKVQDYLTAIKYSTYKLIGDTNHLAFTKTFPDKMVRWKAEGRSQKEVARYTTGYNQSKLVTLIMEQARMPTHLVNADVFQDAINIQAKIMADESISPKVRSDAANSLMTHLKRPEAQKIELGVSVKNNSVIEELHRTTMKLAAQQQSMVDAKVFTAKEIAHQPLIIEGTYSSGEE